jgi:hypothetical protein
MSEPTTSENTSNATSSPGSGSGQSLCVELVGPILDLFGREVAPVSPIAQQKESAQRNKMSATFGRIGQGSLQSIALQKSLESKLRTRLPMDGWMTPFMTWRRQRTPALRQYCRLALSKRLMNETAFGLFHTPRRVMIIETPENFQKRMGDRCGTTYPNLAVQAVYLALWRSPIASDHRNRGSAKSARRREKIGKQIVLSMQVKMAVDGLPAQTENTGQLNPGFVCWIMGYLPTWLNCARQALATPSSRKSRRSSSKPAGSASHES